VNRPNLPDGSRQVLAELAESLGQFDLAARLFQQLASQSNRPQNRLALVRFLGHRGRTKDALDMCEPLWSGTPNLEGLVTVSLEVVFSLGAKPPDLDQMNRVAGWMEKALERNPESSILMIGLGNLRERQGRYADAETLYRRAIQRGEGDVIALNNLAWLMALRDGQGSAALDLINRAIAFKGPLPEFLDTRGVVYLTSGQSQRAIDDLENAVAVDPSASKYFHLAQAYLEANKREAAKQSLAKAHTKGLKPTSLHPLEVTAYQEVLSALETH
jgi:cellulose synthase operon protein C